MDKLNTEKCRGESTHFASLPAPERIAKQLIDTLTLET